MANLASNQAIDFFHIELHLKWRNDLDLCVVIKKGKLKIVLFILESFDTTEEGAHKRLSPARVRF